MIEKLVNPKITCQIYNDGNCDGLVYGLCDSCRLYHTRKSEREALYEWGNEPCTDHPLEDECTGLKITKPRRKCDQCWQSLVEKGEKNE